MIYLDHNATSPLRPEVAEALSRAIGELGGNPSSLHAAGRRARHLVECARADVAAFLGVDSEEIVFTSGGTEADHLAILGLAEVAALRGRRHIVTSAIEHPAVLAAVDVLARRGFTVEHVPLGTDGELSRENLERVLRADTGLVTLALANHEIGNLAPIADLAEMARERGALFHTDAVQAAGKMRLDARALGVDAATISAHKIGGPPGIGAVYVRRGLDLAPVVGGGHQERERRPGTENLLGTIGFAAACRAAGAQVDETAARLERLRARLEFGLRTIAGARIHGRCAAGGRVPGTTSAAFSEVPGQLLVVGLDLESVCISTGAACSSGALEPSPVLRALGPAVTAEEGVRISLGWSTTEGDVDRLLEILPPVVERIRRAADEPASEADREADRGADRGADGGANTDGKRERIVVAMSGGVDSSTAAALLVERGYEVVGVTLRLYNARGTAASLGGRCCGPRDIEDARATAAALGIPHYVLDATAAFGKAVIDEFVAAHAQGRTPNPCVRCNEQLKFTPLLRFASAVGARMLATGHYARLVRDDDRVGSYGSPAPSPTLLRARDATKDQSYFLFGVPPWVWRRVMFPLGDLTKDDVRTMARRHALPNADKPDSQEICFIPDGDHLGFVEKHGGAGPRGRVIDESGAVLAQHAGTHRFTVGQRKGVPATDGQRRFVLRVHADSGDIVVGPRESLARRELHVSDVRWTLGRAPASWPLRCAVQIRHHAVAAPAWVRPDGAVPERCAVELDAPAYGVTPGQAAVFYEGDRVVGGGFISAS